MKLNLWQNEPEHNKKAFRDEAAKTNYLRVYYMLRVLLPIAILMAVIATIIEDTQSIRMSHLILSIGTLLLLLFSLFAPPKRTDRQKIQKWITDGAYLLLLFWSFTLLGYNPQNLIAFVDVVIVVMVMAFLYITTWEKLASIYIVGLGYLFFLTPYISRSDGYVPLLTTSMFTVIAMFFLSRVMHQYYLNHFVLKKKLEAREQDLEKQLVIAMHDLLSKEKQISQDIIRCLAKGVEFYDQYTRGHSENVANYARAIAKAMGLSYEEQEKIYLAGLIHDVGKMLIPSQILNKPAKLTNDEFSMIKQHSRFGYDILCESESLSGISDWVLHHHEHWNGKGYPEGLKKDYIPLQAQILAVADAFDAITSDRVYRKEKTKAEGIEEIRRCSGTQFSPQVVQAFAKSIEE